MLIAFGVTFELPLVLLFLGLAGVIGADTLRRHRRGAIVGIAALAAVVTPSQDPYTMLAMAVPLYLLYEVTILLLRFLTRKKRGRVGIVPRSWQSKGNVSRRVAPVRPVVARRLRRGR